MLLWRDDTYSPSHSIALDDFAKLVATLLSELLGVVEEFILVAIGQNDSSSVYATRQAATTCFVATSLNLSFVEMTFQH